MSRSCRIIFRILFIERDHNRLRHLSCSIGSEVEMKDRITAFYLVSSSETYREKKFVRDKLFVLFRDIFAWRITGLELTKDNFIIGLLDSFSVIISIHTIIPSR